MIKKKVYDNMTRVDKARQIVSRPYFNRENIVQSPLGWNRQKLLQEALIMSILLQIGVCLSRCNRSNSVVTIHACR
jgi:hypothetical protein